MLRKLHLPNDRDPTLLEQEEDGAEAEEDRIVDTMRVGGAVAVLLTQTSTIHNQRNRQREMLRRPL